MTDLSAFQHKFRAIGPSVHHEPPNKVNKRNRLPVSCEPCRSRKLKCSRGHPCESCVQRGDESSCQYRASTNGTRSKHEPNGHLNRAQERLQTLEGLVMQMMQSDKSATQPTPEGVHQAEGTAPAPDHTALGGLLSSDGSEPSYVGATHWAAILDNIQDLKSTLPSDRSPPEEDGPSPESPPSTRQDSLFCIGVLPTLEQVLHCLPNRQTVDRRLSVYFKAKYAIIPIVHIFHFQRMYEKFWNDPFKVPVLWIAQFFAILCLSAQLSDAMGAESPRSSTEPAPKDVFLTATAQCLALGDYAKNHPYAVEALLLFAQCKYMNTLDPAGDVWILFGIIVRQALSMGYHRDPKHFPQLSVFDGEMRRRTWTMIRHFDLMNCFQMGLPSSIQAGQYDTAMPLSLHDSDFDEWSKSLPPPRSEDEVDAQVGYFLAKGRLMTVFEKILKQELSMESVSYSRVLELDTELREAHGRVPTSLKHKPMSQSFADPAHVIMVRMNIELLYQKSICVLHRKYLTLQGSHFKYSRDACATAAISVLDRWAAVHQEALPGGQLYQDRWMLSSFAYHDFFLAAMVVCLDVSTSINQSGQTPDEQIQNKIDMLYTSYLMCNEKRDVSKEARKVANALAALLVKLKPGSVSGSGDSSLAGGSNNLSTPVFNETIPEQVSSSNMTISSTNYISNPFEDLLKAPDDIDWVSWAVKLLALYANIDKAFMDQYLTDPIISGTADAMLGYPDSLSMAGMTLQNRMQPLSPTLFKAWS